MRQCTKIAEIRKQIEAMKWHTWAAGEASLVTFDQTMLPCNKDCVKEEALFTMVLEIPWAHE